MSDAILIHDPLCWVFGSSLYPQGFEHSRLYVLVGSLFLAFYSGHSMRPTNSDTLFFILRKFPFYPFFYVSQCLNLMVDIQGDSLILFPNFFYFLFILVFQMSF